MILLDFFPAQDASRTAFDAVSGPWFSLDIFFIGAERRSFKDHFGYSWIDPVPNKDF
jgi:hypothetical protein